MSIPQGLSLADLGPLYETVLIGDKKLAVYGVSAAGIFAIFNRFPEMQQWVNAGATVAALVGTAPQAMSAIIAAGCNQPDNPEAEAIANALPVETQIDILEVIARLTFKNGFGPFVDRIIALAALARQSAKLGRDSDTISRPASKLLPPIGAEPILSGN